MSESYAEVKVDLQNRLKRIEGQARGIQRMLDEGRDCKAILQQLSAIRSAAQQASLVLIRSHAAECLRNSPQGESPEAVVDDLVEILGKIS